MADTSSLPTSTKYPAVKLPHPFLTAYKVQPVVSQTKPVQLTLKWDKQPSNGFPPPKPFHSDVLSWFDLTFQRESELPPLSNNGAWARARRSAETIFSWTGTKAPSLAQIWTVVYAIYLAHPTYESFRVKLKGAEKDVLRKELLGTGLGIEHPPQWNRDLEDELKEELLILRSSFWQGAGSPTGPRPIWVLGSGTDGPSREPLDQFPPFPETYQLTMKFPQEAVYAHHPIRRPKPAPGSIVYSRYIPDLDEHFSLEAIDCENPEHLRLFHTWQNDPRVAQAWNETGTLDQHREYLRKLHRDPHVVCLFGRFDDTRFSYFEVYWAQEDPYGAHYTPHPYDRGRHNLVGNAHYRGAQRVSAWYSSSLHYCFLDDARTLHVVGEPKATGRTILSYENSHGLTIGKYVDFAHKRSVHSVCSREKWFQLCPVFWDGRERPLESADRAAWNAKL